MLSDLMKKEMQLAATPSINTKSSLRGTLTTCQSETGRMGETFPLVYISKGPNTPSMLCFLPGYS